MSGPIIPYHHARAKLLSGPFICSRSIPSLWYKYPREARHIPTTAHTLVKIIHRQRDSAIITKAQTTTRPNDNASR